VSLASVREGGKGGMGVEEGEKENESPPPEPEMVWDEDEDEGEEGSVEASEAEAVEMQARMEDLLKDLGLFRRKVADDHSRFGVAKVPLSEVRVN